MSLLEQVKAFLRPTPVLATDKAGAEASEELRVATVVLLLRIAYGDHEFVPKEREAIRRGIQREFGISATDAKELIEAAARARRKYRTSRSISAEIVEHYTEEQRAKILDLLWQVIYADKMVDEGEEVLAQQVTEMVGLTPEQGLEARRRAFVWFSEKRDKKS